MALKFLVIGALCALAFALCRWGIMHVRGIEGATLANAFDSKAILAGVIGGIFAMLSSKNKKAA